MNNQSHRHARSTSKIPKSFASIADENRRLATDCLRVLRLEMQLETIFHLQVCFVITEVSYFFFFFFIHINYQNGEDENKSLHAGNDQ